MKHDLRSLSNREREALRLLGRGHEAKSIAMVLNLSVHTVNERLRAARRKLGVSSSREAARLLVAYEGTPQPENPGYKEMGVAVARPDDRSLSRAHSRALLLTVIGAAMLVVLMSLLIATHPAGNGSTQSLRPRQAEPVAALPSLFAASDYPPEAVKQGVQGITDFRLHVTAGGAVDKCDVERSSGSAALDQATCRVITRRARFRPAINRAGRPTDSVYTGMIHWIL